MDFNFFVNRKRRSEARKRLFRMMKSPDEFENERFLFRIQDIKALIAESQKLYNDNNTDPYLKIEILKEIDSLNATLRRLETDYEKYKRNKVVISQ